VIRTAYARLISLLRDRSGSIGVEGLARHVAPTDGADAVGAGPLGVFVARLRERKTAMNREQASRLGEQCL